MARIKSDSYSIFTGSISENIIASGIDVSSYSSVFILVDENTHEHCWPHLMYSMSGLEHAEVIEIPSGEENKVLEICYHIWNTLSEVNADRKALMINLGGGVIGDMGGFAASTYKRGIDFIQIPTTLLSQVDASVGGKLGIDFEGYKNQIGVFNKPKAVFVDVSFLETLDERNMCSGFAEMLKHALIADAKQWEKLKQIKAVNAKQIARHISPAIKIKNTIVKKDFLEQNIRKTLNFGHTIGHAVESALLNTPSSLLHGEAIAIGMAIETILSNKLGLTLLQQQEIFSVLKQHFSLIHINEDVLQSILELIKQDKKNSHSTINCSLLTSIGNCAYDCAITEQEVVEAVNVYNTFI